MKKLYLKYKDDVFRFSLSIVKHTYSAEDITQETFLKLLDNYNDIKDKSKIKAWLFTTARNLSLTKLNELNKLASQPLSENVLFKENNGYFELISFLSIEEQQLVSLRIIGKFKWKEIAKILGLSEESAKKRYQRILNKIKNQVKEEIK